VVKEGRDRKRGKVRRRREGRGRERTDVVPSFSS